MKRLTHKKFVVLLAGTLLFAGCSKHNEQENNLADLASILRMPASAENAAEQSRATDGYDDMPEGLPIVVEVEKSPLKKDPLDKGPFVNMTRTVAHLGFLYSPDSLWGVWEFDTVRGKWIKTQDYPDSDSTIIFRWLDGEGFFQLKAGDFVFDGNLNVIHALFELFIGDSEELAWLRIDTMAYEQGNPTYVKYTYDILSLLNVTVSAAAEPQHHLREPHIFGTINGIVHTNDLDTLYTSVHNRTDLSQSVSISFRYGDLTYQKEITVSAPDSVQEYILRNISGVVYSIQTSTKDTIGIIEGKIWKPQDSRHKNYLDIILKDSGERIHLWN